MSFQYARIAAIPRSGVVNGVSRNTASSVKMEQIASTSPRSHPLPNVSINALYSLFMRANILLVVLLSFGCRPAVDDGYTLLFLGRFAAARVGRYSWAADPAHSRLIAFDGDLHGVRTVTNPRISSPAAIAPYPGSRLLVTERTAKGVVFDTAGAPVREWESPFAASLYATDGSRIVASRSPYYVLFVGEDGSAPLVWMLDTLGAPYEGVGVIHVPVINYLAELVNAWPAAGAGRVGSFSPPVPAQS